MGQKRNRRLIPHFSRSRFFAIVGTGRSPLLCGALPPAKRHGSESRHHFCVAYRRARHHLARVPSLTQAANFPISHGVTRGADGFRLIFYFRQILKRMKAFGISITDRYVIRYRSTSTARTHAANAHGFQACSFYRLSRDHAHRATSRALIPAAAIGVPCVDV